MRAMLLLFLAVPAMVVVGLEVMTEQGPVVGEEREETDPRTGQEITWTQYLNIPYAAAPVGERRFRPPSAPEPWVEPRYSGEQNLTICPQLGGVGVLYGRSDEDCLYLHLHVPQSQSDPALPVMVWIHGGGFMSGDGTPDSFGPQYWLAHGVIIVTINYRLGPLGYLSLGLEDIPGNMGQLDQVMALTWVQDNIARFGGDPDLVTIFGQSAGAAAVTYQMFSERSRGLFRRVIAQSGLGGFMPSFHHHQEDQAARYGNNAALLLGCLRPEERAACLREKSVVAIQSVELPEELLSQPCIDRAQPSPALAANPLDLVRSGQYQADIDIMLGVNEDDGLLISEYFIPAPSLYEVLNQLWDFLGPFALFEEHHTEITAADIEIATHILNFYTGEEGPEGLGPEKFVEITEMFTDSFFWFGNYLFLKHHLQHSTGKTYQYRFSYDGEYHRVHAPGLHHDNCPGVTHSDELYFMWNPFYEVDYPLNDRDLAMSLKLTTMWTNFAKTGDPSTADFQWQSQDQESSQYLRITRDGDFQMELGADYLERVTFWEEIMMNYNFTFNLN